MEGICPYILLIKERDLLHLIQYLRLQPYPISEASICLFKLFSDHHKPSSNIRTCRSDEDEIPNSQWITWICISGCVYIYISSSSSYVTLKTEQKSTVTSSDARSLRSLQQNGLNFSHSSQKLTTRTIDNEKKTKKKKKAYRWYSQSQSQKKTVKRREKEWIIKTYRWQNRGVLDVTSVSEHRAFWRLG